MRVLLAAVMLSFLCVPAFSADQPQRNKFQKAVDAQHDSDIKRKNELLAKMREIIGGYNKRLKQSGVKDANLDIPIPADKIEDVQQMDTHTSKPVPSPVYAYLSDDTNIFTSSAASSVVEKVSFSEQVEILEKSEKPVLFKGHDGVMVLVRRATGNEGWVHSTFLLKTKPKKRAAQEPADISSSFDVPVSGTRTSSFGTRVDPVTHKQNAFHSGIDIAAPKGTPVAAAQAGTVRRAEFNKNGYGNLIVIEHQKDFTTYYGHLSVIKVAEGQSVKKGDNIGAVGSTGKSTGPHLHFEVRRGDKALDPDSFLK